MHVVTNKNSVQTETISDVFFEGIVRIVERRADSPPHITDLLENTEAC